MSDTSFIQPQLQSAIGLLQNGKMQQARNAFDTLCHQAPQLTPVSYTHLTLPTIYSV